MACARRPPGRPARRLAEPEGRPESDLPSGIRIRPERARDPAEVDAIGRLHDAAFQDPQVAPLVVAIRASPRYLPGLSLVAEAADESGATVVGHIMISGTDLMTER